jgi:integration host factor subunit beta
MGDEECEASRNQKEVLHKSDLVEAVAEKAGVGCAEAPVIVELIFESIVHAIERGERVEIRGFGTFSSHGRGARNGRNPTTGEPVAVPAKRVAGFKASRKLLDSLNRMPIDN